MTIWTVILLAAALVVVWVLSRRSRRKRTGKTTISNKGPPALIDRKDIPQVLPILPLRNSVLFPAGVLPLAVGRQKSVALIKDAARDEQVIGVVTQRRAEEKDPGAADLYTVGTVARIVKHLKMDEDSYSLVVQGLARVRVLALVKETPYLEARIEAMEDCTPLDEVEVDALAISLKALARELIKLMPEPPSAATELVESITHPGHLADLIAANVDVPIEERQQVLETLDLKERMKFVLDLLARKKLVLELFARNRELARAQTWQGKRGVYWIAVADAAEGEGVHATAIGPVAEATASTREEAIRLIIERLEAKGA